MVIRCQNVLETYPEPDIVVNQYGADAVRLYSLSSQAVQADDLRFSEIKGLMSVAAGLDPSSGTALFSLSTYAKIYDWHPDV
jgi:isoleucyl-tRNA synthetase